MYDIYVQYYMNSSNVLVTTEQLIYSIPIAANKASMAFTDPVIKVEMGKTGSFEFSMPPTHPLYNSFLQMKTVMRVVYDNETLFRGRVLTIDNERLTGVRKVHLEGDFAFLMDSYHIASKEEDRDTITLAAYLNRLITSHNTQMNVEGNRHKQITLGEVPGNYTSASSDIMRISGDNRKYGSSSYRRTADALSELQKEFGGYFRTRYVNGTCYLDWLDNFFNPALNGQEIRLASNLIDINDTSEVDNIFTVLIPTGSKDGKEITILGYREDVHGHNRSIQVPQIVSEFSDAELNKGYHTKSDYQNAIDKYGIIYTSHNFSNADTQEKLWNYALDYIKTNYVGGIINFTIGALDLHHINANMQKLCVGDQVKIVYPRMDEHTEGHTPLETRYLTIKSIQYYLYNPEKNSYEIGIPNNMLSRTYGTTNKKSGKASDIAGGVGPGLDDGEDKRKISREEAEALTWTYIIDKKRHSEMFTEFENKHPNEAATILKAVHLVLTQEEMDDTNEGVVTYETVQKRKMLLDGISCVAAISSLDLTNLLPWQKGTLLNTEEAAAVRQYAETLILGYEQGTDVNGKSNLGFKSKLSIAGIIHPTSGKPIINLLTQDRTLLEIANDQRNGFAGLKGYKMTNDPSDPVITKDVNITENANTGYVNFVRGKLGLSAAETDTTMLLDGPDSLLKMVSSVDAGAFDSENLKILMNGALGKATALKLTAGTDASGTTDTIVQDGPNAEISVVDPADAGSTVDTKKTIKLAGSNNGEIQVGWTTNSSGTKVPTITVNKPIRYEDAQHTIHNLTGAIKGLDMYLPEVGSFNSEFARISTLLADAVYTNQLTAVQAQIDDINAINVTTQNLSSSISALSQVYTNRLVSTGAAVAWDGFYYGGSLSSVAIHQGVSDVQIVDAGNNTYKLQKKTYNNIGSWVDAGVTFSRATSLSGEWSGNVAAGKAYKVTATPQGNIAWSPALDQIYPSGEKTWANDKKSFTQLLKVCDEDGEDLYQDTLRFTTTDSYNAGYTDGSTVVSISGTWTGTVAAGKSYKVTISPQGTEEWSPALDQIYPSGEKSWANDKKSFTQLLKVCDENGEDLYQDTLTFSTTDSYNTGYSTGHTTGRTDGLPVSGTAGGRSSGVASQTVHDFAINSHDGTSTTLQINCASIYTTARTGYTYGTFELATVTPQGSQQSNAYYADDSGGVAYYRPGADVTYYRGDGLKYTQSYLYERDGQVYQVGTEFSPTVEGATLYDRNGNEKGTGNWYCVSPVISKLYSRGSLVYKAASDSTPCLTLDAQNGTIVLRGTQVTVTPINPNNMIAHLHSAALYKPGTPVTDTYYTKS